MFTTVSKVVYVVHMLTNGGTVHVVSGSTSKFESSPLSDFVSSLRGFSPGSRTSSHNPKAYILDSLNCEYKLSELIDRRPLQSVPGLSRQISADSKMSFGLNVNVTGDHSWVEFLAQNVSRDWLRLTCDVNEEQLLSKCGFLW